MLALPVQAANSAAAVFVRFGIAPFLVSMALAAAATKAKSAFARLPVRADSGWLMLERIPCSCR